MALKIIQELNKSEEISITLGLQGSDFSNLQLQAEEFLKASFHIASFRNATLIDTKFDGSFFNIVDFRQSDLLDASFENCIVFNTDFDDAHFIEKASFRGSLFSSLDLSSTKITQEQLNSVYSDRTVTIPTKLKRPRHWSKKNLSFDQLFARSEAWRRYAGYTVEKNPS